MADGMIVSAVRRLIEAGISPDEVSEERMSNAFTAGIPDLV